MDYLPHGNVRRLYPRGTALPLERVVTYVTQVASALQYAHDQKLIHRDVKPENILLDHDQSIVLSDFGIALMAQSSRYQSTQAVAGTAAYMAPEQFQGHPHRASDQYALGIVVYEWLSGDRPFHGTFSEIASQHMFVPPPPLRDKRLAISTEVEKVVLIALEKDPQRRFESVKAFAAALEQACQTISFDQVALPTEFPFRSEPSLPSETVAPVSHPPSPQLTNVVTPSNQSLPPTEMGTPLSQSVQTTVSAKRPHTSDVRPPLIREPVSSRGTQPSKQFISRRAVVTGLVGLAGVSIVGGSIAWLTLSQNPQAPSPSITPGTLLYTYESPSASVSAVAWSPDGKLIASVDSEVAGSILIGEVQVRNASNGSSVYTFRSQAGYFTAVTWSPGSKRIASGYYSEPGSLVSAQVQVWDASDGGHLYIHTFQGYNNYVNAVTWSPDGKRIASANNYKTVQVWDANTGTTVYTYRGHSDSVNAVAWSPDGKRIASASEDTTVQVWQVV